MSLSYAAEKGHEVVVELLLKEGVEPHKAKDGRTLLSYAVE